MNERQAIFYHSIFKGLRRFGRKTAVERMPDGRIKKKWRRGPNAGNSIFSQPPRFITRPLLFIVLLILLLFILFGEAFFQQDIELRMLLGIDAKTVQEVDADSNE